MKRIWNDIGLACVLGLVVPWMILGLTTSIYGKVAEETEPLVTQIRQETQPISGMTIMVGTSDEIMLMNLEEYLLGVVLAEMPASFETEALKAQAVVARTYTLRAVSGKSKHEAFAVCTDSACCQGYISPTDYVKSGGKDTDAEKIREAILATRGLVVQYDGELIEATYFSCSGGRTEDAVAVWGTDVAYLQSVASPGEEKAKHYSDTFVFSASEFAALLEISPEGKVKDWFGNITRSEGGSVLEMEICGKSYRGTELRTLLGLTSAAFTLSVEADTINITTSGYGHRVGMSQYGANAMAAGGSTFREILNHYYTGTTLASMED